MQKIIHFILGIGLLSSMIACTSTKQEKSIERIPIRTENGYQYINTKGDIVIDSQFAEATLFHDGLALVKTTKAVQNWGYIDINGNFIIEAKYEQATLFSEGFAWVVADNQAPSVINRKGNLLFTLKEAQRVRSFSQGLAPVQIADSLNLVWGYVNTKGKLSIPPQFDAAYPFHDGIALIRMGDKFGFINLKGEIIVKPQYADSQLTTYCQQTRLRIIEPYTEVQTDYFDVKEIVEVLRSVVVKATKNHIFDATFGDIVQYYGLNEEVFNKFNENNRIANVSISEILGYDIYIEGQAWKKSGNDTYQFLPNAKIKSFSMYIQLSKGGEGKAEQIFKTCKTAFGGYTLDPNESTDLNYVFKNKEQKISVWGVYGASALVIKIEPIP
ncbi:MAG: WG repeat-containing protein [Bacteroidales bacterium]